MVFLVFPYGCMFDFVCMSVGKCLFVFIKSNLLSFKIETEDQDFVHKKQAFVIILKIVNQIK